MYSPQPSIIATPSGLKIATYAWGGEGEPILLAHPTGFHGRVWAPVVPYLLDAGHAVYSFDFRGHGDSDHSPNGYAWSNFGDDITAVADHLELAGHDKLIAAGHSKGGASILLAELSRPGIFKNVWAFEPIVFPGGKSPFPAGNDPLANGALRRRNEWVSPQAAYESYSSKPPMNSMTPASLHAYVDHGFRDRGDGVYELKCAPQDEAQMYRNGPANGIFERLSEIQSNVHVHVGADSFSITPKLGVAIVEQIKNASLTVWDGNGHFGPQEDPARAARSILAVR